MADKKKKKEKKKGYFLYTVLLFFIFLIVSISSVLFLDIIGFFNISKMIPLESNIGKMPYIGKYLKYSYKLHLSEEDRIKITVSKYQEILENQKRQLELKEQNINILTKNIKETEDKLNKKEEELNKKEEELNKKEEELNKKDILYEGKKENITKFSEIYSKMDPQKAAMIIEKLNDKIVAGILEKMETKKVALILESLSEVNINKAKEITEIMTLKGDKNEE